MSIDNAINDEPIGPNGVDSTCHGLNPHGIDAMVAAVINAACRPGGAIDKAIDEAITRACQPAGAIFNLVETKNLQMMARLANMLVSAADANLAPIPDARKQIPEAFPRTLNEFRNMDIDVANSLCDAYGLDANGTLDEMSSLLGIFCNVNM